MTKKTAYHVLYYWFPVLAYCVAIFIQSSCAVPRRMPAFHDMDKLLHLACYAILGALLLRGFTNSRYTHRQRLITAASVLLAGLYGATDEWHQHFVIQRSADGWDIVFDFLGGLLGVYIYRAIVQRFPRAGRI